MKPKTKTIYTSGKIFPNGDMLEQAKEGDEVFLIHYNSDGMGWSSAEFEFDGVKYKPIDNALTMTNTVLFPSDAIPCDSIEDLRQDVQDFIHRYCDITEYFEVLASYYVLLSWVYEHFNVLPYLSVIGEPGTGKSRFLQVIGSICYKPMRVSGAISVASIFRMIAEFHGTLILEEADLPARSDEYAGVVKILNCGFEKGSPVIRQEQTAKGYTSVAYDVFAPKIVARRKRFDDRALETRMITERMTKMTRRDNIALNLPTDFDEQSLKLRNRLMGYRFQSRYSIKPSDVYAMSGIEPRILQIVSPMLDIMPEDEHDRLLDWARAYTQDLITERATSVDGSVVTALFSVIDNGDEPTVKGITDKLNEQYERDSDKLSYRRVGAILNHLGLIKKRVAGRGAYAIDTEASAKTLELLRKQYGID